MNCFSAFPATDIRAHSLEPIRGIYRADLLSTFWNCIAFPFSLLFPCKSVFLTKVISLLPFQWDFGREREQIGICSICFLYPEVASCLSTSVIPLLLTHKALPCFSHQATGGKWNSQPPSFLPPHTLKVHLFYFLSLETHLRFYLVCKTFPEHLRLWWKALIYPSSSVYVCVLYFLFKKLKTGL